MENKEIGNKLSEIEKKDKLSAILTGELGGRCDIVQDFYYRIDDNDQTADLAVFVDGDLFALFEIKSRDISFFKYEEHSRTRPLFFSYLQGLRFYIVADLNSFFVYDVYQDYGPNRQYSLSELIFLLKDAIPPMPEQPYWRDVANPFVESIQGLKFPKHIIKFVTSLRKSDFDFDTDKAVIYLKPKKEERLFHLLLNTQKNDELCRYSTLDSLFKLLKDQHQNMCNPICMNDRGEYRYADRFVFGRAPSITQKAFMEVDDCYVLSLMAKNREDDLTMWRLYGDDAKGACFTYSVNWPLLKSKPYSDHFYLSRISYGSEDGSHRELEFIRRIVNKKISGWRFQLKQWSIWKHFFKSHHFAVEQEVRLLYLASPNEKLVSSVEWIKNSVSQIVTKMQVFDLSRFPLKPVLARVGPKCQEAPLLARQFQQVALAGNDTKNMKITTSDIKDYR